MSTIDVVKPIFVVGAVAVVAWTAPVDARVVTCESSSPLADRSDRAIDEALNRAVDRCVRDATAMGLASIRLDDAVVRNDRLVVQMIATDEEAIDGDDEVQVHDLTPRTTATRGL